MSRSPFREPFTYNYKGRNHINNYFQISFKHIEKSIFSFSDIVAVWMVFVNKIKTFFKMDSNSAQQAMDKNEKPGLSTYPTKSETVALCGMGLCHPLWLQRCANITCYSISYGLTVLMTNALGIYISSQITTLEKQFNLSSSQSGFILSCNDIGFIITVLFVSHFGIR